MRRGRSAFLFAAVLGAAAVAVAPGVGAGAATSATISGSTRLAAGSVGGGFTADDGAPDSGAGFEYLAQSGDGAALASDRSHSGSGGTPVGAISQPKNVTTDSPGLLVSFQGLNHFDNRFGVDRGRQFSLEPPDQGLCVGSDGAGNTRVMEALNDVVAVYDTAGNVVGSSKTSLNGFYNEGHAIVRGTGTFGEFETDPSCLYDASAHRWFVLDLAIDVVPHGAGAGHFTGPNHLNLAVSDTQDPTGGWTIFKIDTTDDGVGGDGLPAGPNHACKPGSNPPSYRTNRTACFGDFPHLGADANGVYLTTNEYSFFGPEFHGAQVYALSKSELVAKAVAGNPSATASVTQFDTHGADGHGFALNGFTLWPTYTPGGGGSAAAGGTEYFVSSNAGAEAHDIGDGKSTAHPSTQLLLWSLTNTTSLNGTRSLSLANSVLSVGEYAPPSPATQKSGSQPLRECLNSSSCSQLLEGIKDPFAEKSASLDASDSRVLSAEYVNGQVWATLDTGIATSNSKQAGIEWFKVTPGAAPSVSRQGYLALGNDNLTYGSIAVTSSGKGVIGFTLLGNNFYPSAGYAAVDSSGPGDVHVAAMGVGPDDGFSNYALFGDPAGTTRPRWGDYAASVPVDNTVWIANEYIAQSCTLSEYVNTNFRCGNTRTALANWSTRISQVDAS